MFALCMIACEVARRFVERIGGAGDRSSLVVTHPSTGLHLRPSISVAQHSYAEPHRPMSTSHFEISFVVLKSVILIFGSKHNICYS